MDPLFMVIFWSGLAGLFFTFLGYPLLMRALAQACSRPLLAVPLSTPPPISVVLVVYNEESRLADRLENLLASDYPPEQIELVVVSDGSKDRTSEIIHGFAARRVKAVLLPERRGKSHGINAGLAAASGEIVIFADARQRFAPDTIWRLVEPFADAQVGAVSGRLVIERSASTVGAGVGGYWELESRLRADEATFDSCIGCTGAVYALRRTLFTPIPDDTLLDDVVIPMQAAMRGARVWYAPEALAYDPQSLEPDREQVRKRRTLAGNFQMLFRHGAWLLPWKNRLWWQLIAHKYLRLAAAPLLLLVLAASMALAGQPLYRIFLGGQLALYALALIGLTGRVRGRVFSLPAGFVFLNWLTVRGLLYYLRGEGGQGWQTTPAKPSGS